MHVVSSFHSFIPASVSDCVCFFAIFSVGGLILDKTVSHPKFEGMAVFTPLINGKLNDASDLVSNFRQSFCTRGCKKGVQFFLVTLFCCT